MRNFQSFLIIHACLVLGTATLAADPPALDAALAMKGQERAAALDHMLVYIPEQANTVMAVRLSALLDTPLARKENWKSQSRMERLRYVLPYPNDCGLVVVAAKKEAGTLKNEWALMLLELKQPEQISAIAERAKAATTTIDKTPAVMLSSQAILLGLPNNLLAIYGPAERQDAVRLLQHARHRSEPALSPFLRQSLALSDNKQQIVIARDTADAIDPIQARVFVKQLFSDKATEQEVTACGKIFASMTGVQFIISVDTEIHCQLKAFFSDPLGEQAKKIPGIVTMALESMGLDLETLQKAEPALQEKSFELKANLTTERLEHLLSMMQVAPQEQAAQLAQAKPAPAGPPVLDKATINRQYFQSVVRLSSDAHKSADRRNDYLRAVQLYENAARRIDLLPKQSVDDELTNFAAVISQKMRGISAELYAAVANVQALERTITYNANPNYGTPWGYYNPFRLDFTPPYLSGLIMGGPDVQTNQNEVIAKQSQVLATALKKRTQIWNEVLAETAQARQQVDLKYPP
jgi:hypothetical protein